VRFLRGAGDPRGGLLLWVVCVGSSSEFVSILRVPGTREDWMNCCQMDPYPSWSNLEEPGGTWRNLE
jgi:hypothetical protein